MRSTSFISRRSHAPISIRAQVTALWATDCLPHSAPSSAHPSRPSVCLIGDGGLQFSLPELASAVEAKIPVAIIVWNNESYGEIKAFMAERHIPQIGVDIFTPDLGALATSMGCGFSRPQSIADLRDALIQSVKSDVPTVIEIKARSALAGALAS